MNEFYEDLMYPFVRGWLQNYQDMIVCQKCCSLCIQGDKNKGTIQFHEDNIVELSIKDNQTKESLFYLHFQMHDMNSVLKQFHTFFQYLTQPYVEHQKLGIRDPKIKKILLSCSGGLTSSYFAYSIQEMMNQKHIDIQVDAVAYSDIDSVADKYDMILLAPQIGYMLADYKRKYGNKVMTIESIDFATSNFEGIMQKALH